MTRRQDNRCRGSGRPSEVSKSEGNENEEEDRPWTGPAKRNVASPPRKRANPTRRASAELRPLLDVQEVATWLGVDVVFVRRLVSERRIPFLKIGKYVRFDPDEVLFWIRGAPLRPPPGRRVGAVGDPHDSTPVGATVLR